MQPPTTTGVSRTGMTAAGASAITFRDGGGLGAEGVIGGASGGGSADSAQLLVQNQLVWVTLAEAGALALVTLYLLRRFSARSTSWWVALSVFAGWFLGFSGMLVLPLDIAFTQSNDLVSSQPLVRFWEASFWITTIFAYALFPLLKGIVASGAFTCAGKVRQSLWGNIVFYVVALTVVGVALVWVWVADLPMNAVVGFVMALSNIYGLLLITVLLSFGLVDTPRYLWMLGDYPRQLRRLHLQVRLWVGSWVARWLVAWLVCTRTCI
jgi:hypothetical protein